MGNLQVVKSVMNLPGNIKNNTMKNTFHYILSICLIVLAVNFTYAQQAASDVTDKPTLEVENTWKTLSRITYKKQYDEMMGFKVDIPIFSDEIKALEGKEVIVKGYVIPVEGYKGHKEFVFSAFPYNMCFFCNGAGPETVMEVLAKEDIEYSPDAITIKGKLTLNDSDINHLIYGLTDVVLVEE